LIRQARTYLRGAVSATALIAAAVVAFVVLVSLQALENWPLAGSPSSPGTTAVESPAAAALAAQRTKARARRPAGHARPGRRAAASPGARTGDGGGGPSPPEAAPAREATSSGGGTATHSAQSPVPVEAVTGAANGAVSKLEEAVNETGVTTTAGAAVQEVAGSGSAVGGAVGKVTEVVGGLTGEAP
jgi:hypothetical protein